MSYWVYEYSIMHEIKLLQDYSLLLLYPPFPTACHLPSSKLTQASFQEMIEKFFSLVTDVTIILSQKMSMEMDKQTGKPTFKWFRQYVAGLCNDCDIQHQITVEDIFKMIHSKSYWDLKGNPYELLLSIAKKYVDAALLADIKQAEEDYYSKYLVTTVVADHMEQCEASTLAAAADDYKPNFVQLSLKLRDLNVNESSVAYLTGLWKDVRRCVRLPDLYSILFDIERGCVAVSWLVPLYAVPALARLPHAAPGLEIFSKYDITEMTVNGVSLCEVSIIKTS